MYWLKAIGRSVGVEAHRQQEPFVAGVEDAAQRHRIAALGLALSGLGHQLEQLALRSSGETASMESKHSTRQPDFFTRL